MKPMETKLFGFEPDTLMRLAAVLRVFSCDAPDKLRLALTNHKHLGGNVAFISRQKVERQAKAKGQSPPGVECTVCNLCLATGRLTHLGLVCGEDGPNDKSCIGTMCLQLPDVRPEAYRELETRNARQARRLQLIREVCKGTLDKHEIGIEGIRKVVPEDKPAVDQ